MFKKMIIFVALMLLPLNALATPLEYVNELVHEAISEHDVAEDPEAKLTVRISKGSNNLTNSFAQRVELSNLTFDTATKTFAGHVSLNENAPFEITGRYSYMIEVPALNRKLRRHDVISAADITYTEISVAMKNRGYIMDEEDLIGKSPTRTLQKNRPVLPTQIQEPNLVTRKQAVTMVYKSGSVVMQDMGVALEDGAKGELIKIRNATSDIIIHGVVIAENLIEVSPRKQILAGY